MGKQTAIEWCDRSFNIAWGCMKVSPGCQHCYAETIAQRLRDNYWGPESNTDRRVFGQEYWDAPLKWALPDRRARVFCSSMCDLFEDHHTVLQELVKLWPLIARTEGTLDWLLLTKRAERIHLSLPADWGAGYPNVWPGVSVENNKYAALRIPHLLDTPARLRFLSVEPMLEPVDLTPYLKEHKLHWVICGGESGRQARPMQESWARDLLAQCRAYDTPFFMKQMGSVWDKDHARQKGGTPSDWPTDLRVREFPK